MKKDVKIIGLGYCGMDYLCVVPRIPFDDKVEIIESLVQGGGPSATAVVAASRLGADTAFYGSIGDDGRGKQIIDAFKSEDVDAAGLKIRRNAESPAAYCWIDQASGKRSIAWTHGDAAPLKPEDINSELLGNADVLHLDGHQTEAAIAAAKEARSQGVLVSLDAGTLLPGIEELMELSDIVIASEKFAQAFTDFGRETDSIRKLFFGARKFAGVTSGKNGSLGFDGVNIMRCPLHEVKEVVDTTGAGDVYHGAFAVGAARGMSWEQCMRFATVVAALKCTALGGRTAIPDF
ncbi:MAG: PfkB family carbohydrate kinase [Kiritimatiellia bacterium]